MTCVTCGGYVYGHSCYTCGTPASGQLLVPYAPLVRLGGLGGTAVGAVVLVLLVTMAGRLFPLVGGRLAAKARDADDVAALNQAATWDGATALAFVLAFVVAAVLVIMWMYRARRNLDSFTGARPPLSPGWAVAGWFVPVANLVIPCRVMLGVARACLFRTRSRILVGLWWLGWVGAAVLDQVVTRWDVSAYRALPTELASRADFERYIAYYDASLLRNAPVLAAMLVSGIALIALIVQITAAQDRRIGIGLAMERSAVLFGHGPLLARAGASAATEGPSADAGDATIGR